VTSLVSRVSRRTFLGTSITATAAAALSTFPFLSVEAAQPRRIIIDADTGVDDAIAILLALRSPELKVEAFTAVSGNVPLTLTLPNTLRMVEIAGRTDIPVAAGAATPLVRNLITASYVHGTNGLGEADFPEPKMKPVAATASEVIRRLVYDNPGEITIVAIGPLTNVALALKSDAAVGKKIKEILMMGGSLSHGNVTPSAEFNFYVDPEAARVVFDSGVPLTMVGLNVTERVRIGKEQIAVLEAAKNSVSQAAAKILRSTIEHLGHGRGIVQGKMAMHDPLTVAYLLDPSILTLKEYYVQIETTGELSAGESVGYEAAPVRFSPPMDTGLATDAPRLDFKANTQVAVDVDSEKFFKLLLSRLTATN